MTFFNNNTSQILISVFCDWFAKLSIEKYQTITVSGDDYYAQRKVVKVPICWGAREKMYEILRSSSARRNMNPELNNQVEMQWILPRISVNLSGASYDASRRMIKTQQMDDIRNSNNSKTSVYSPTPYNLELEVSTISRNVDENFQLMEQIIPYFSPTMNMNVKVDPTSEPQSIPITLNSVSIDNPVDIPENDERLFTNVYNFTIKANYFIPKKTGKIIDHIEVSMVNGMEVIKLDKTYIESLNLINDKFTMYVNNSSMTNPLTSVQNITPIGNVSTYSDVAYGTGQEGALIENLLNTLGSPEIILTESVSG